MQPWFLVHFISLGGGEVLNESLSAFMQFFSDIEELGKNQAIIFSPGFR